MPKSRIFLEGVVSASILAMSAAGPALANTSQVTSAGPVNTVSSVLPAGNLTSASPLRGVAGILGGLPITGRVTNRVGRAANHVGRTTGISNKTSGRALNGDVNRLTGSLPGSGHVTSDLKPAIVPGLSPATGSRPSMTGALSGLVPATGYLGSITGAVPGLTSVNSDLPGLRH